MTKIKTNKAANSLVDYKFDVDKIVLYLKKYSDQLNELYKWNSNINKLVGLKVLTNAELNSLKNQKPYDKEIVLKKKVNKRLLETRGNNTEEFNDLCLWIIKDWGGITAAKNEETIKLINTFLKQEEPTFNRIASSSKVGSFLYPEKNIIYDSRVAYSLNWIILSENAGDKFFPIPEGRNSKMTAFEMNVLIRLKNVESYKPNFTKDLDNGRFINNADKNHYIPAKKAYSELNKLIIKINKKLWTGEKAKMLYYTEMLLFSIADRDIYNDITKRTSIKIR